MDHKKYYNLLLDLNLITPIYGYLLDLVERYRSSNYLNLLSIYFSLVCFGNVTMSLDKRKLKNKWDKIISGKEIELLELDDSEKLNELKEVRDESRDLIENDLEGLKDFVLNNLGEFFDISDGYIYLKKLNHARINISKKIEELFKVEFKGNSEIDIDGCFKNEKMKLTKGQIVAVNKGVKSNLLITGGPGTGKTTSIFFILLNLLKENPNYNVYLAASGGKASGRMKESIEKNIGNLSDSFKEKHQDIIDIILGPTVNEYTIHRLLGTKVGGGFNHNSDNQFDNNSIFVIDEASMIDINLFSSLLSSIKEGSRLFILGDKNQLPSVDVGSVFNDLLKKESLKEKVCELDESMRFNENTDIYKLAKIVNENLEFDFNENVFKDAKSFRIEEDNKNCPVFFYNQPKDKIELKKGLEGILEVWSKKYVNNLQNEASNLNCNDFESFARLINRVEESKILCAQNEGVLGTGFINDYIKKASFKLNKRMGIIDHYPGEVMMITSNNKALHLYNGDNGILVSFKDDPNLYFMVKASKNFELFDGYKMDRIFKIGEYIFYPLRLIDTKDITLAFSITIHKSQGSDYKNILIVLPSRAHHPLLNRQILYTALTRTKGNTYIYSSFDRLKEAKENLLERDTNI